MGDRVGTAAVRATAGVLADLVRGGAHPRWRKFLAETWGHPRPVRRGSPVVWLVAPAGGEVVQTWSFCPALREAFPDGTLMLSTGSHAFLDVAQRIGGLDARLYTPWDLGHPVRRALAALRPDVLVTVEAAWSPVLLREARRRGVPTMLASGTMIGDYHRATPYRRALGLRVFDHLDVVGVKDEDEAAAFTALGVPAGRVRVLGDLRLDPEFHAVSVSERADLARWLGLTPDTDLLVAGSLHRGEEAVVLDAYLALRAGGRRLRLLVAPRYLAAVPELARACVARGLTSARLSGGPREGRDPNVVLLLDTYGDLRRVYAVATWVLLGGSLVKVDIGLGQNLVEPLAHGVPVFFGPHMARWARLTTPLLAVFPGLRVESSEDLARGILALGAAPALAAEVRARARGLMQSGGDAVARHVAAIAALVKRRVPRTLGQPA